MHSILKGNQCFRKSRNLNKIVRNSRPEATVFKKINFPHLKRWDTPTTISNILWTNFNESMEEGNRALFVISLDRTNLHSLPDGVLANGLFKFVKEVLNMKDVFIISMTQALEWLQRPTPLENINNFSPWKCLLGKRDEREV